jgi:catechol 2,3-dioxygenase-like lactoylglutathione lyase family enzyme
MEGIESLFSTQTIMIMLLGAYGVAMWMFLTSAPKVHTVMVSDLDQARDFYEAQLSLPAAKIPLHYYYGYDQTLGSAANLDPIYMSSEARQQPRPDGLWYQLEKNTQLHIVGGANAGKSSRDRHLCFNRDCVEQVLLRIQVLGIKHKIRSEKPLKFLVRDVDGNVIEIAEVDN